MPITQAAAERAPVVHALIIAVDRVDPEFYIGWQGELPAAAKDAEAMTGLFKRAGINPLVLRREGATRQAVLGAFDALARDAQSRDVVVIYFSGHGARLPDLNGDELQKAQQGKEPVCEDMLVYDEAWCLYDRMLIDDEISEKLTHFAEGVAVVFIIESCFGGTSTTLFGFDGSAQLTLASTPLVSSLAPAGIDEEVYKSDQVFYDEILRTPYVPSQDAAASILSLAASTDCQYAFCDPEKGSVFTNAIVTAYGAAPEQTYGDLFDCACKIVADEKLPLVQTPTREVKGKTPRGWPELSRRTVFKPGVR